MNVVHWVCGEQCSQNRRFDTARTFLSEPFNIFTSGLLRSKDHEMPLTLIYNHQNWTTESIRKCQVKRMFKLEQRFGTYPIDRF